ncbi:MAG: sulfotransferase family protein [Acidimicrobiia bacterium]
MTAVVVLGMYRSGTSALTRALGLLGSSLGPPANLGKFWESRAPRGRNERILAAFGGGWDCPPVMPEDWVRAPEVLEVRPEARAALATFGDASVFTWKDPRTCLTLPFWLELLDEPPVIVFTHRHPLEVAASQARRDQLGTAHSFALWERYNGDALRYSQGLRTFSIEYPQLLADPVGTMRALVDSLEGWGVHLPRSPETTDMELSTSRRHHHTDVEASFDDPLATPSQRDLFDLLRSIDGPHDALELPKPVPEPGAVSVELLALAARANRAEGDARRAKMELRRRTGSRRNVVRTFVDLTMVRLRRRTSPGATPPSTPPR